MSNKQMETIPEEVTTDLGGSRSTPPRALIADDQPDVLAALRLLFKGEGYRIETVTSPEAIIEALKAREYDVLLMDLNYARDTTSGQEGLDLLGRIQSIDNTLPIVVMTAWSSVPLAVESMRRGVRDFVEKPWENDRMVATLRAQVEHARTERARRRLEAQERDAMQETERLLLPTEIPQMAGYEIFGVWQPLSAVGGDYFDARKLDERTLALSIADVAGKGMPAALLMSNLQAAVKAYASEPVQPGELCSKVNRIIHGNIAADKFISFFYALLDASCRRLTYSNAGHNAPILVRRDGSVARLETGGALLGIFPDSRYEQDAADLRPGDLLALFTDGVTEVRNGAGEEFGEERLVELLVEHRTLDAEALENRVLGAVMEFSRRSFQDDATLIIMKAVVSDK